VLTGPRSDPRLLETRWGEGRLFLYRHSGQAQINNNEGGMGERDIRRPFARNAASNGANGAKRCRTQGEYKTSTEGNLVEPQIDWSRF